MPTYSEIYNMTDPKEKVYAAIDRIAELKQIPSMFRLSEHDNELRNLEVMKMKWWSDWKDPE